jgi:hypothetical protein
LVLPPQIASGTPAVKVRVQERTVTMHQVFDYELTALKDASPSTQLTFFGISFGSALALLISILSTSANARGRSTFIALFWPSLVLSVYFAVRSIQAWLKRRDLVDEIRSRPS